MSKTITQLATQMYKAFVTDKQPDGETFDKLKPKAPSWMTDVARAAHAGMLPDDWKYEFIRDALSILVDHDGNLEDAREDLEADIYTSDLLNWLASNRERMGYVEEAVNDNGWSKENGLTYAIQWGQLREKEEVLYKVHEALEGLADA